MWYEKLYARLVHRLPLRLKNWLKIKTVDNHDRRTGDTRAAPTENTGEMTSQSKGRESTLEVQLSLTGHNKDDVTDEQTRLSQYLDALKRKT